MRTTEDTYNEYMENMVYNTIKNMWDRLIREANLLGTSLGTIANRNNISASAVYAAIRKINRSEEYVDTAVSQIATLAYGLGIDIDEAVTGEPTIRKLNATEKMASLLPEINQQSKNMLKLKLMSYLEV